MERIVEILEEIQPGVDYETCENLIDGGFLDSLSIINIVAELEDTFDIMLETDDIIDLSSYEKGKEILSKNYNVEF